VLTSHSYFVRLWFSSPKGDGNMSNGSERTFDTATFDLSNVVLLYYYSVLYLSIVYLLPITNISTTLLHNVAWSRVL